MEQAQDLDKTTVNHEPASQEKRRGRVFDYGELRVLLLSMLAEQSSHGYELIHAIKARFAGLYKPSPGVIYPTLTWLYDRGYAVIDLEKGGRKRYSITPEGKAFLAANHAVMEMLQKRIVPPRTGKTSPPELVGAMDHLKRALNLRASVEPENEAVIQQIADAIHSAAQRIETLLSTPAPAAGAMCSIANIATPNAARFVRRLCSHFQHRTPVVSDELSGQFRLSLGEIRLEALPETLRVILTSDSESKLIEMEHIIVRHLAETAVRETLDIQWSHAQ